MKVQQALDSYSSYEDMEYYPDALNSLLKGLRRYDENIDEDLDATMKRADTMMYENKQKFKQNRQNGI